jgi:MFS family permease
MALPQTISAEANDRQSAGDSGLNQERHPSARSLRGLDWLNFLLADVQTGVGPFLAIYLAGYNWNEQRVGVALTIGGIAGIVSQTPTGGLVDRLRPKRSLIAAGVIALAIGALLIAFFPSFWPVMTAQMMIGAMSSVFMPAIAAISVGIVGPDHFNRRQGRNQTFNSAGNVTAAVMMGFIGYFISNRGVFFLVAVLAVPTLLSLLLIQSYEIDYELARGARDGEDDGTPASIRI